MTSDISTPARPSAQSTVVRSKGGTLTCSVVAGIALLCAFTWQLLTVTRNYGGDWSALYCIGSIKPVPPAMDGMYRFAGSNGYDGQIYLMMALDPLFRHGTAAYIDEPGLRYRRILLPAAAYLTGLGNARSIVYTYILLNLAFLYLGTWWMSRLAVLCGRHAAWGWMFLAVPSVPISLDRQTVDLALTALALGAMWAWQTKRWRTLFVVLALVCLVRETGMVVAAGFALAFVVRRQWGYAAGCFLATTPFMVWTWMVGRNFPPMLRQWMTTAPYEWTVHTLLHPASLPLPGGIQVLVACFDLVAVAGLLVGAAASVRGCIRTGWASGPMLSSGLVAGLCVYLFSLEEWTHVYDFGRIASPMAALLLADRAAGRLGALPAVLMTSRVLVQLTPQILGAIGVHV